jgi:hypothetical protein
MRTTAILLSLCAIALAPLGSIGCAAESGEATGEEDESLVSDDPQEAAELEAELAKEDTQVETEVKEELADDEASELAFEESGATNALTVQKNDANGGTTAPHCKKKISVVFAVGAPRASLDAMSNGCWETEIADTSSYRHCWYDKPIAHANGTAWVYDDTNVTHGSYESEAARVHACDNGGSRGYEYLANRGGWRFIGATHLDAYFAELYSDADPRNIDDLWHMKSAYKQNPDVKMHRKRTFPMIAVGERDQRIAFGRQALATCKTVRNNGYFGLYSPFWHPDDKQHLEPNDVRLRHLAIALNRCTEPKATKKK